MLTFKILGPLEVVREGRALPLGAAKQRALIACLLVHEGEVVSTDRLIDDLWGQDAPSTAEHMLHVYVSRFRKLLEDDGPKVLLTQAPGYRIELGPDDVLDAALFEVLLRQARDDTQGDPAHRLDVLNRALGLWRGTPLADVAYEAFAQAPAGRLEELRATAEEERIEALLALGRVQEAIPELDSLVTRYPLREQLRAQQMLALYRAGRQADALGAFQDARQTLARELGVDPGPALRSLEEAILRHDPALLVPEATSSSPNGVPQEPGPPIRHRRRLGWVLVPAVVVLALVVLSLSLPIGDEPDGGPEVMATGPQSSDALLLRWSEDPGSEAFGGPGDQVVLGGARTTLGYMAFGYTAAARTSGVAERDYDAAVWVVTAPDGWNRVQSPSFAAAGNQRVADAAVLDDAIVAVGIDESSGDFDAAVWLSATDEPGWSRVDASSPSLRQTNDQGMRDVTVAGSTLVAVGFERVEEEDDAASWTSTDGRTWVRSVLGALTGPGDQQMATVVTLDDLVVAAGFSFEGDGDAAIWTSPDGTHWQRIVDDSLGGPGDQKINAIAAGGPGLVAVGEETVDGETDAVAWVSSDGSDWDRVDDPAGAFGGAGAQRMFAVTSSPLGVVAAGEDDVGRDTDAAVWTSADGTTWERLPGDTPAMSALTDFGRQSIKVLIASDDGFLALGAEGRGADDDADAWIGLAVR